jgi:hypothetical protein
MAPGAIPATMGGFASGADRPPFRDEDTDEDSDQDTDEDTAMEYGSPGDTTDTGMHGMSFDHLSIVYANCQQVIRATMATTSRATTASLSTTVYKVCHLVN